MKFGLFIQVGHLTNRISYVNLFKSFFEGFSHPVCCFSFPGTDFTQSHFVFINKTDFLELKMCPKYLTKILKVLTENVFAETFCINVRQNRQEKVTETS